MRIDNLSVMELKALAYDIIGQMERCKIELEQTNRLIASKMRAENGKESTNPAIGKKRRAKDETKRTQLRTSRKGKGANVECQRKTTTKQE